MIENSRFSFDLLYISLSLFLKDIFSPHTFISCLRPVALAVSPGYFSESVPKNRENIPEDIQLACPASEVSPCVHLKLKDLPPSHHRRAKQMCRAELI